MCRRSLAQPSLLFPTPPIICPFSLPFPVPPCTRSCLHAPHTDARGTHTQAHTRTHSKHTSTHTHTSLPGVKDTHTHTYRGSWPGRLGQAALVSNHLPRTEKLVCETEGGRTGARTGGCHLPQKSWGGCIFPRIAISRIRLSCSP